VLDDLFGHLHNDALDPGNLMLDVDLELVRQNISSDTNIGTWILEPLGSVDPRRQASRWSHRKRSMRIGNPSRGFGIGHICQRGT
jgi:hypothetical protein